MQDRSTFGALREPRSLSVPSVTNITQFFSEIKSRNKKNQFFWFMEKRLSYNFHIWKNVYQRDLIRFSVRSALYEII